MLVITFLCIFTQYIGIRKMVTEGLSRASEIKENLNFHLGLIIEGEKLKFPPSLLMCQIGKTLF